MNCEKFNAGLCQSCDWLDLTYDSQLQRKQALLQSYLEKFPATTLCDPVASPESAFRNKAKMAVLGTVDHPILGIVNKHGSPVDLSDCPLYPDAFYPVFEALKTFIKKARLTPYNVAKKRGELKFVLLHYSEAEQAFMLRFVLRSHEQIERLCGALPALMAQQPRLQVVSANIQPVHMAVMEGAEEIIFTSDQVLIERLNALPLRLRPGGFFQTNSNIASRLYQTAAAWIHADQVRHVVDLFCGSGGFGLTCLPPGAELLGLELSEQSLDCARDSAKDLGVLGQCHFRSFDLRNGLPELRDKFAKPDLVLVNPPRRGLGGAVCDWIDESGAETLLYSSCNAASLFDDLQRLQRYSLQKIQLFDMFPHTAHFEVLTLLQRQQ